jgi:RNA polymerase sigma factor FliA
LANKRKKTVRWIKPSIAGIMLKRFAQRSRRRKVKTLIGLDRTRSTLARARRQPKRIVPGSAEEEQLVLTHLPLVRLVVGRMAMSLPAHVDAEDLYSAGSVGLLKAIRNFNPDSGTALETYARLRIRGSVLDELRSMDWVPRSVHSRARKVQSAMCELEQSNGRVPTELEVARALRMSLADYQQLLLEIRPATFICLDAATFGEDEESLSHYESLADPSQGNPLDNTARRERMRLILDRLQQLPAMQRKVLALYYFEGLRLREIAEVFGLTESRICQIHSQAIITVRAHLRNCELACA